MTKKILMYTILVGLFAIPFIPFIVPTGMFFPFITGKGFTFRILVEVLFGLYAVLAFLAPEYRPKMSWISKAVGFFAVAILISDLLSANVSKSLWSNYERMEGFVLIFHLVLYYIVASSVLNTKSRWHLFFNINLVASVIMSIFGAMQLMGKLTINQGGVRLDGTFGNASYFAIYLVFNIFLALYMLSENYKTKWLTWVYGIIAVGETYIIYFTATRGAILGLIGGLLLSALILAWKEKENQKLRKWAIGVLVGIVVLVVGFIAIRNTSFVQKSPVLSRFAISTSEIESQGRYFVWPMALKGIVERPVFGWGQESFNFVFNKNYDPRMYAQEQWFDRTHDIFLDWLIAGGIVGFLAYASMFGALLYYIWYKKSKLLLIEKGLLTGLISAYVFHNIFVFDNLISYILFFSILGFIHSISVSDDKPVTKFYTKTFSPDNINYGIMPSVFVLVCLGIYFINVPAIQANLTLIQAMSPQTTKGVDENLRLFKVAFDYNSFGNSEILEQLIQISTQVNSSTEVSDATKKGFYDLAKQKIEEKTKQTPDDARYFVFAGNFFNRFGQYAEAEKYLLRAIELSPKKQSIYFELGTTYIGEGKTDKTFEVFKKAYDLAPEYPESKIIYAVGAIYTRNATVLKEIMPQIDQNTFLNDNRVIRAYADIGDFQTVINLLTIRVQDNPANMQYKLSLASAYLQVGNKQKAIEIINQMIAQDSTFKAQGEDYIKQIQSMK